MAKYGFANEADGVMAGRMITIRVVWFFVVLSTMCCPIALMVWGVHTGLMYEDSWVSLAVTGSDDPFWEYENPYVCQKPSVNSACTDGWTVSQSKIICFKFYKDYKTYKDAEKECAKNANGYLAAIRGSSDNDQLHKWCEEDAPCWIGLRRDKDSDKWYWAADSASLGDNKYLLSGSYENWGKEQPVETEDLPDDEQGGYGVLGWTRMAAVLVALGSVLFFFIGFSLCILACIGALNHKALTDKNMTMMLVTVTIDVCLLVLFVVEFVLVCVSLGSAENLVWPILAMIFIFVAILIAGFLIFAGVKLRGVMASGNAGGNLYADGAAAGPPVQVQEPQSIGKGQDQE